MNDTLREPGRRAAFLRTLRRLHAWTGLTGAGLGPIFRVPGLPKNPLALLKIY